MVVVVARHAPASPATVVGEAGAPSFSIESGRRPMTARSAGRGANGLMHPSCDPKRFFTPYLILLSKPVVALPSNLLALGPSPA